MAGDRGGRLGGVSDRQLARALDRHGLGKPVATAPVADGHFGQNLFVTSTTGRYVLRGRPHHPWQFPTERFYADLLHERTSVPVPWPYLVDPGTDIFGWSYVLMPRLPGQPLSDGDPLAGMAPADQRAVARALAETLAEVHTVTWEHPGRYRPGADTVTPFDITSELAWPTRQPRGPGGPPVSWRTRVVERTLDKLRLASQINARTTTPADLAWTTSRLGVATEALDLAFRPSLVLEDFKPGNVLVAAQAGSWRVTGLFDLMEAHFGDGEADLSRMLCTYLDHDPALAELFLGEYLTRRQPRPGFAERFPGYLLLDRALLWFFFQHERLRYWPATWTFQDWAGRYLDLAGPVLARATRHG